MAGKSNYRRGEYPDDEIKLRNAADNDEVNKSMESAKPKSFAEELRKRWLRAAAPKEVMVDGDLKDVVVQTSSDLCVRSAFVNQDITWIWTFEITTQGMPNFTLSDSI